MSVRRFLQTTRPVSTKPTIGTPKKFTPAMITEIEATAANTIRVTFSTRIVPARMPQFKAGAAGDETVDSMTVVDDTTVELVFTGDVAGTDLLVGEGDQGIRTWPSGFVPAGSYAIPTFP